jgi:integrase
VGQGIHRLSATKIAKTNRRGLYADGGGLFLQVAANGSRSWLFRYSRNERRRHVGLGPTHAVDLAKARDKARECRALLHDGVDPLDHRNAQRAAAQLEAAKAMIFDECAEAFIASHEAGWKNERHVAQWRSTLKTYVTPVFGKLPIQSIDTALVMKALDPIWKTKPETASRLRGRIEAILAWATVRKYRQGDNPARWKGHLDQLLPARSKVRSVEHHAALPYAEIGGFMADLRGREAVAARALEFLILTAGRTSEILHATWTEIDQDNRIWTVPSVRMKSERLHRVPLSDAALGALETMKSMRESEFIFPGSKRGKRLSNMAMLKLLERMGHPNLTAHGFRSTFRDWAAERTSFQNEVVEMALAHAIPSKAEAAYRRGDLFEKRRRLMKAWADYCEKRNSVEGNVVPMPVAS